MATSMIGKSAGDWDPGNGKGEDDGAATKLMNTEACECMDNVTGTNELKPFMGGAGVPKGPFGIKGNEF